MATLKLVGPCEECNVQVDPNHDHMSWCNQGMLDVAIDMALEGHTVQFGNPAEGSLDRIIIQPAG